MMVLLSCFQSPSHLRLMLSPLLLITYHIALKIFARLNLATIVARHLPTAWCLVWRHHIPLNNMHAFFARLRDDSGGSNYLRNRQHSNDDDSGSQQEAWDQLSQDS